MLEQPALIIALAKTQLNNGQPVAYAFKLLFLFVISGAVAVAGQPAGTRNSPSIRETDSVSIEASADTRFLLIECPINH